jgi:hypothetical protein
LDPKQTFVAHSAAVCIRRMVPRQFIGPLQFKDGASSAETATKVYDTLDFTRALDVFLNSYPERFPGAPPGYAPCKSQYANERNANRRV